MVKIYLMLALSVMGCASSDGPETPDAPASSIGFADLPTIEPQPILRFGIPDSVGGASAEMGRVLRVSNGFVVADWDGRRLLQFNQDGHLSKVLGRSGSGPGEFQAPSIIQVLPNDSVLVWDPYLRRITWVTGGAGGARQQEVPAATLYGGNPIVGSLRDGRLVVKHEKAVPATAENPSALASLVAFMRLEKDELEPVASDFPVRYIDAGGYRFFAPTLQVATNGQSTFVGFSSAYEIVEYGPQGQRLGVLSRPWQASPVTEDVKAAIKASMTRPDMAPGFLNDDRFEPSVPAFGEILPSVDGTVWVMGYRAPSQATDSVSVFSPDRRYLGTLRLPEGFRPTQVGADYLLGSGVNAHGDFEVRLYAVRWQTRPVE